MDNPDVVPRLFPEELKDRDPQTRPVTFRCGVDPHCAWWITDIPLIAERERARHERKQMEHREVLRRPDVEASWAWTHPYRPELERR